MKHTKFIYSNLFLVYDSKETFENTELWVIKDTVSAQDVGERNPKVYIAFVLVVKSEPNQMPIKTVSDFQCNDLAIL